MKHTFFLRGIFIVIIGLIALVKPVIAQEKPVMLYYFSEDCEECHNVKAEFLPEFLKKYQEYFTFTELSVSLPANIDSLYAMESRVKVPEQDKAYPAVYFMGVMIEGEIPVKLRLESLVKAYLANPDSMRALDREVMARIPELFTPDTVRAAKPVHMAYFYKQNCKECSRALEIVEWLEKNHGNVTVHRFDIAGKKSKILAAALGLKTGVPEQKIMSTPVFFIGRDFVLAHDISREKLSGLVKTYSAQGSGAVWEQFDEQELKHAEGIIKERFRSFGILAVALAGLGDGINPCAFATILFFVSYLGMIGRKGRDILIVGFSFAFAVFITYFLVGLGFFYVLRSIVNIAILAKIIFGGTAVLCIVFGFLSIADYFKARAGNTAGMSLQLPTFLKKRIHATIRDKVRMKSMVAGAIIVGFLVSILEFACTGQVYLPTISFMVSMEGFQIRAIFLLLMYNLFFIAPLLAVFGIVYKGVSSQSIAKIMETRVGTVKLMLAAVFFVVAALMIWSIV
ncbi:hypothetical protein LLG96_01855 [bacterium]|nr:hypothetical protein [bacterium]